MSISILNKYYNINTTIELNLLYENLTNLTNLPKEIGNLTNLQRLYLDNNKLTSLPNEIGNLINLKFLSLGINKLTSLPKEIGNLINLERLDLNNNNLTSLPKEILKIKEIIEINYTSYEINNLSLYMDFILLSSLSIKLTNLPIFLKEIWLKKTININLIKLPFGCEIKYF